MKLNLIVEEDVSGALLHIPTIVVHPFRLNLYSDSDVVVQPREVVTPAVA
jgi:hypothetical protein